MNKALPVLDEMRERGRQVDDGCMGCGNDGESILHGLVTCPRANEVWLASPFQIPHLQNHHNIKECSRICLDPKIVYALPRSAPYCMEYGTTQISESTMGRLSTINNC
ncbi:hypothetical protein Droror1_Dr00016096 [Drosera rotundifolia]